MTFALHFSTTFKGNCVASQRLSPQSKFSENNFVLSCLDLSKIFITSLSHQLRFFNELI